MAIPLTQEQFQKARASGFTTDQIIDFEKKRLGEGSIQTPETMRKDILERQISQRPDIYKQAVQGIQNLPQNILQSTGQGMPLLPVVNVLLKSLGGVGQRYEAAGANPLIEMGRKPPIPQLPTQQDLLNPLAMPYKALTSPYAKNLIESSAKGITGERLGEYGDIYQQAGIPQPIASALGLVTAGATMNFLPMLKSKINKLQTIQNSYNKTVGKNFIRQATGLTPDAVDTGMEFGWKEVLTPDNIKPEKVNVFTNRIRTNIDKISNPNIRNFATKLFSQKEVFKPQKVDETLPRKLTLKIQEGLLEVRKGVVKTFGDDYEALAKKVMDESQVAGKPVGGIPTKGLVEGLRQKLVNNRIIDLQGNDIAERISSLSPSEEYILNLYKRMRPLQDKVSVIGFNDLIKIRRQLWGEINKGTLGGNKPYASSERLLLDVIGDVGDAMGAYSDDLIDMNGKYRSFMQWFNPANDIFKPFKGSFGTKRGENILRAFGSPNFSGAEEELLRVIDNSLPKSAKFMKQLSEYALQKATPVLEYIEPNFSGEGKLINFFNLKPIEKQWIKMIDDALPKDAKFLTDLRKWLTTQEALVKPASQGTLASRSSIFEKAGKWATVKTLQKDIPSKVSRGVERINKFTQPSRDLMIPPSILRMITGRNQ